MPCFNYLKAISSRPSCLEQYRIVHFASWLSGCPLLLPMLCASVGSGEPLVWICALQAHYKTSFPNANPVCGFLVISGCSHQYMRSKGRNKTLGSPPTWVYSTTRYTLIWLNLSLIWNSLHSSLSALSLM